MALLDRKIAAYWSKRARDEQQRERVRTSLQQYNQQWGYTPNTPGQFNATQPAIQPVQEVKPSFLARLEP